MSVASVRHSHGQRQAIAFGRVRDAVPCAELPLCEGHSSDKEGRYFLVKMERGGTDTGSSGAGLFLPSGELVGVLHGGFSDCESSPGPDHYGRFGLTYGARLSRWLGKR